MTTVLEYFTHVITVLQLLDVAVPLVILIVHPPFSIDLSISTSRWAGIKIFLLALLLKS